MLRYALDGDVHLLLVFEKHKTPPVLSLHSARPAARVNVPDARLLAQSIQGSSKKWTLREEEDGRVSVGLGRSKNRLHAPRACWERLAADILSERARAGVMPKETTDCSVPSEPVRSLAWHLTRPRTTAQA